MSGYKKMKLDLIALLKKEKKKHKRLAQWYNPQTQILKQTLHKFERKRHSTKLEEACLVWLTPLNLKESSPQCQSSLYFKINIVK